MNFPGSRTYLDAVTLALGCQCSVGDKEAGAMDRLIYDGTRAHLDLVRKIAASCGGKMVRLEHVKAAEEVARAIDMRGLATASKSKTSGKSSIKSATKSATKSKMQGGAETVLPSEYFGRASASYFRDVPASTAPASTPAFVRSALPFSPLKGGACPCSSSSILAGGAETVLPSEYFGRASASYFKDVPASTAPASTPAFVRSALPFSPLKGGAETVLPSEYFGRDSGRYFAHDALGAANNGSFPTGVARAALPSSFPRSSGGGTKSTKITKTGSKAVKAAGLSDTTFSAVLQEYRKRVASAAGLRITDDAKRRLRHLVAQAVLKAVKESHAARKTVSLTAACLHDASDRIVPFVMA